MKLHPIEGSNTPWAEGTERDARINTPQGASGRETQNPPACSPQAIQTAQPTGGYVHRLLDRGVEFFSNPNLSLPSASLNKFRTSSIQWVPTVSSACRLLPVCY